MALEAPYPTIMSTHSVADARDNLSVLIDRAIAGEPVVITRHGQPVVELRATRPNVGPISAADLAWLAQRRVKIGSVKEDAATLVSRMRDEDWR